MNTFRDNIEVELNTHARHTFLSSAPLLAITQTTTIQAHQDLDDYKLTTRHLLAKQTVKMG
uniref:Uncharacterized protein n=1 Tax=Helianthus annuus TaxID=4232 RepID=A0A251T371_HELAN